MTRTHQKHWRAYVNGVDLSGYTRQIGALGWVFDAEPDQALTDGCKNILIGKCDISSGPLNAFLDNDAAGLYSIRAQTLRNVMYAMGAMAAPVAGDNVFCWKFEDTGYAVEPGGGFVAASLPFGGASSQGVLTYKKPWGKLLHAKATRLVAAGANTGTGIDDYGADPPSLGGIFVYHLFSSDGTVTLSADEADTNLGGSFAALSGATSGEIDATSTPQSGMVALATNAAVKRYLRFQIAYGTATTATFASAFIRNTLA